MIHTFQNWQNIFFEKDSKFCHQFAFLSKMLSSTFLFDKQTWICLNLNIFLSIFNVPMATAFKLIIVEQILEFNWFSSICTWTYLHVFKMYFSNLIHQYSWPDPLANEFYCVFRYNFIYIFQNIFFKDAKVFSLIAVFAKTPIITFSFWQMHHFKKKLNCLNLNIFGQYSMFRWP